MEREPDSVTTAATSNQQQQQSSWDDLCFDPHQSSVEEGNVQGREAGALAGFRDGQALGRTKGTEFGMELGFIRGFLNIIIELGEPTTNDRIQRSMHALARALDDFPGPDAMFEQAALQQQQQQQQQQATSSSSDNNKDDNDSEDPATKLDVIAKMQRVRARFRLLTVQLGIPHYSLKQVMDEASSHHKTTAEPPADNEW